jgi:hypothetical protein
MKVVELEILKISYLGNFSSSSAKSKVISKIQFRVSESGGATVPNQWEQSSARHGRRRDPSWPFRPLPGIVVVVSSSWTSPHFSTSCCPAIARLLLYKRPTSSPFFLFRHRCRRVHPPAKFITVAPPLATPPYQQFCLELARLLSSIPPCLVHRSVRRNPFFLESGKKLRRKHATVAIRFR